MIKIDDNIGSYSPFHYSSGFSSRNQALLVQFALIALTGPTSAPFLEHLLLFPTAFSDQEQAITSLTLYIKKKACSIPFSSRTRRESLRKLLPFLQLCKSDEGFWLFLLKQGHRLDSPKNILSLLQELYLEDLATVSLRMSSLFTARGFCTAAKESIFLLHNLQQHYV